MNIYRKVTLAAMGAALLTFFASGARAELREEKITVTFSGPVEVPGEVLPAGTYVFEGVQDGTLTRILNADETHVYTTLMTVPSEMAEPADKATVIMKKAQVGSPERVDAWFFPGDSVGSEFLYRAPQSKSQGVVPVGAKEIGKSSEFIAVETAHGAAHFCSAVHHAEKFIVG